MTTDNNPSKVEQITAQLTSFVNKINQDLQISTPSKLFDVSPFQKAAFAGGPFFPPPWGDIDKEGMERIRQMGNPAVGDLYFLSKERTMEQQMGYSTFDFGEALRAGYTSPPQADNHTFLVILPGNDRRHIQAAYMEVDGGSLYFEDDNRETFLAFGPGHWVWAERVEEDEVP